MSKKYLTCTVCDGQNLDINKKFEYGYRFTIQDGKMSSIHDDLGAETGVVWISCSDCRRIGNAVEWKASVVEKRLISNMIDKSSDPIDVSELLREV